jgi:hypothetical protein
LGWSDPAPIATAADITSIWSSQSDGDGNIVVIWLEGTQIWSRIYQRSLDTWTRALLVASASTSATFGQPQMAAGNVAMPMALDSTTYAAFYQRGIGWIQSSIVDLTALGAGDFTSGDFGLQMSMDSRGNVLAVGHTGYRRYSSHGGWQPVIEHGLGLGVWRLWMAAAPDGSVVAVTHDLTLSDEFIPEVVRFE